jgi:hypothetical protein
VPADASRLLSSDSAFFILRSASRCFRGSGFNPAAVLTANNLNSPGLTAGIFLLHPVQQHRAFQSRLIAQGDGLVFLRQFEELLAHGPPLRLGQLRQLIQDFGCAHGGNITNRRPFAKRAFLRPFLIERNVAKTPRHGENWKTLCIAASGRMKADRFTRGKRVLAALLRGGKVKGDTATWLRLTRGAA